MNEAATVTGAESSAQAEVSAPAKPASIHDRIKASFAPPQEATDQPEQVGSAALGEPETETESTPPPKAEQKKPAPKAKEKEETADEAEEPTEGGTFTSLKELAEAAGLDMETIFDFELPTKIDGKDGTVRIRDAIKGYQLEQHWNQKLMTHADEKKAFESERTRIAQESQQKMQQLDAAVLIAQRMLDGDIANTNWQELQASDPLTFNQKYVEMQQREQTIKSIAEQLGKDRQQQQQQQAAQFNAYRADQAKLLDSKIPEWADSATKVKDIAHLCTVASDAYGLTEKEIKSQVDHRLIVVLRDAVKYRELQGQKAGVLKKISAAPKLLKPGVPQSKAAQDTIVQKNSQDRLRASGKVKDATPILKRILYGS